MADRGILSRGFNTKHPVLPCQEQKPCLSWEHRAKVHAVARPGYYLCRECLLTCQRLCFCCKAWLEGSNSPSTLSLIMQGKDWVRHGGGRGSGQTVGQGLLHVSKHATPGCQPYCTHTLYRAHTPTGRAGNESFLPTFVHELSRTAFTPQNQQDYGLCNNTQFGSRFMKCVRVKKKKSLFY